MASTQHLMVGRGGPKYVQMQAEERARSELPSTPPFVSLHQWNCSDVESAKMFDELPKATIIEVSRPDAGDFSPMQLTYTIQIQYKEVRCHSEI